MHSLRCCQMQLRRWPTSGRIGTLLVLLVVFTYSTTNKLIICALENNLKATPWLYPHLFRDRYMIMCYLLCVFLLFCDAPFVDAHQISVISRIGKRRWAKGMITYICVASLIFFLTIAVFYLIALLPVTQWSLSWGKMFDALKDLNPYTGQISWYILKNYSPVAATGLTLFLTWQSGMFLGLLLFFCNLRWNRSVSIIVGGLFAFLDFSIYVMMADPVWIFYLSPTSWINLDIIGHAGFPPIWYCIFSFILINVFLAWNCIRAGCHYEPRIQEDD